MDLSKAVTYPVGVKDEIRILNPVRNDVDDLLFKCIRKFQSTSEEQRFRIQSSMSSETSNALLSFAQRAIVFALRKQDPDSVESALFAIAMVLNRHDPRDIVTVSNKVLYVATQLNVKVPDEILRELDRADSHRKQVIGSLFVRNRNSAESPRGFREVNTRFGIGLIDSDSAPFEPRFDILDAAIDIIELVKTDINYLSASMRIESKRPPAYTPNRGGIWIVARPDPKAHTNMRHQMFHMRLVDFADVDTLEQKRPMIGRANPSEVRLFVSHESMLFVGVTRSYVKGVDNIETEAALKRFKEPIREILEKTAPWDPSKIRS